MGRRGEKLRQGQRHPGVYFTGGVNAWFIWRGVQWRVFKENFYCIFSDSIIFHYQYAIIGA